MALSLFPGSAVSDRTGYNAAMQIIRRVTDFYRDPEYFLEVRKLALPIIAQQLMFSLLNMVGVVFVGQKGETAVAAVGLAGQAAFLLNLVNFGVVSGAAMFTAQFWGKRDQTSDQRVSGLRRGEKREIGRVVR